MTRKILVTAALPYINNVPHMGHIVGSHLPADIFARCARSRGFDTAFVGGSDEHGTPSIITARELGVRPQQLADRLHEIHKTIYQRFGISYDRYSRTSDTQHHEQVKRFFETVARRGYVKPGKTKMAYCETDRMFLPDRFVVGTCPSCGYDAANGDQCEQCSTLLTPSTLMNSTCKICGGTPVLRESNHLYLNLKKLQPELEQWVGKQAEEWKGHVIAEARRWLEEGLKERSITRDLDWGVHVPLDGYGDKVFYVWFDAPIGYLSFTAELGKLDRFWKDPSAEIYHFLGKDNIPFHTIFWPAMLLAHGGYNLPKRVVGYNYLLYGDRKFSKSKGVGVFCYNMLGSDIDVDTLRAYLTTIIPETRDSSFSWGDYKDLVNTELIAKLGNFFNRTVSLVRNFFDGRTGCGGIVAPDNETAAALEAMERFPREIGDLIMQSELRRAFKAVLEYASAGNGFLHRTEPWKTIKTNPEGARQSLHVALNMSRSMAIVASPFLPESMQRLWAGQLKLSGQPSASGMWDTASELAVGAEHEIGHPEPLYAQITDTRVALLESTFAKPHPLRELING